MNISTKEVISALSHVDDPDLKKDLVTLNMIREVKTDGLKVKFTVMLTTPACPLKEKIRNDCKQAIYDHVHPGAEIDITMSSNVTAAPSRKDRLKQVKNIIAVVSGKGGVGKSTVASNLAVALSQAGAKVALCDGDIYGPSVPIMFGLQGKRPYVKKVGDRDLMVPFEQYGVKINSIGFLVPEDQAIVWRGPMASKAMQQLLFDTDWGEVDYLVLDMPPGTGDLHLTLVQHLSVTGVVVVTTPQNVALADARKGAEMFRTPQINVPLLGIIENMAYFVPEDMPEKKYYIFGEGGGRKLAADLETDLLGQIPIVEKVREMSDIGRPAALDRDSKIGLAFSDLAAVVAQRVAIRNSEVPPTEPVEILHK
ncbi:MAG TPA: iron-sulfur cluster carrier protein ApbC [Bacteroidetes bacterium]|nr:iron-sulfur cluster carrier protein ApbC [Bacteroidota bacterium]